MTRHFQISLAQLNPTLGDISSNAQKAYTAWTSAKAAGSDLVALPEMFLPGYQAQDLSRRPAFVQACAEALGGLTQACADGPALAIGLPYWPDGAQKPFNAYTILQGGKIVSRALKHHLPNDDVFDEHRYFEQGAISGPVSIKGVRIGTPICEDAWFEDVCETLTETGAEILLVPNGSPYAHGKQDIRYALMTARVVETGLPLIYLNLVGGQDDQIFDGASFVLNPGGGQTHLLPAFEETLIEVTFTETANGWQAQPGHRATLPQGIGADYHAMVVGLRDYVQKTGFQKTILGLSGGIDSALVATVACDAVGPDNVRCVMLPSEYTSQTSKEDAVAIAKALGCTLDTLPISTARAAITQTLAPFFEGMAPDVTEENIQSRLRALFLMALSNKTGAMLLTTGNKSEVAVGYATIYGDMAGGYNPIKDMYKTRVFETCRWRNTHHAPWMSGPSGMVIPDRVIEKPPSAELRADQKDEDSLPPYEVLDAILECLIDKEQSVAEIVSAGFDRTMVKRVEHLIYTSEYKRFQSAPGARLSEKAFWLDRRYPIVNRWRDQS